MNNLSDWLYVRVDHLGGDISWYHVLKTDLMLFVKATVKLHVTLGRNPHNGNTTFPVSGIFAYEMDRMNIGHFWWTGPSLSKKPDQPEATILSAWNVYKRWTFYTALRKRGIDPIKRAS